MKYNIGDEFTFINVINSNYLKITITEVDSNNKEYTAIYPDGRIVFLPETFIDDELKYGYLKWTNKVVNSGTLNITFNTSGETTSRRGMTDFMGSTLDTHASQQQTCTHPNKYLNKVFTMQFYVCPDCKKEV